MLYERKRDSGYLIRDVSTDEERLILKLHTAKLSSLYIIDAGEGMTQKTVLLTLNLPFFRQAYKVYQGLTA
jgi:hypothetical protein